MYWLIHTDQLRSEKVTMDWTKIGDEWEYYIALPVSDSLRYHWLLVYGLFRLSLNGTGILASVESSHCNLCGNLNRSGNLANDLSSHCEFMRKLTYRAITVAFKFQCEVFAIILVPVPVSVKVKVLFKLCLNKPINRALTIGLGLDQCE